MTKEKLPPKKSLSAAHKVFRSGRSLVVIIPASARDSLGIKAGDAVKVRIDLDQQKITYHFPRTRQLKLLGGQ